MHRGVRVDGVAVQRLRKAKCLSQQQLAQAAGIAERTVRNAEKGQVLESHIAGYLASALAVPLNDIIAERATTSRTRRLKALIRKASSLYMKAVLDLDVVSLMNIVHPEIEWNCYASPNPSFSGCYRGLEGLKLHVRLAAHWWEQYAAEPGDLKLRRTDAEGDMAYFLLAGKFQDDAGQPVEIWQTFICRFDEDQLISVDQSLGVIALGRDRIEQR